MRLGARLAVLAALLVVAVILAACSSEDATYDGPPPCTPLEGETGDPCEGSIDIETHWYPNIRADWDYPDEPYTIRQYLDWFNLVGPEAHFVVRGQYTPNTVRCVQNNTERRHPWRLVGDVTIPTGLGDIECYADITVAEYIVGSGPSTLTVLAVVSEYWDRTMRAEEIEAERKQVETILTVGFRDFPEIDYDFAGITFIESVLFLGPARDAGTEVLQTFAIWDVERKGDSVIVVHPDRDYYEDAEHRSAVEPTLAAFRTAAKAGNAAMIAEYGGCNDFKHG